MRTSKHLASMKILFVFYLSILSITASASPWIPGYYITQQGDTVQTKFWSPFLQTAVHFNRNQFTLKRSIQHRLSNGIYHKDANGRVKFLSKKDAKEFWFSIAGCPIKMVYVTYSRLGVDKLHHKIYTAKDSAFLSVIADGYLRMYYLNIPFNNRISNYILQKGNNTAFPFTLMDWRLYEYLSDCPEFVRKTKNSEVITNSILDQINLYNSSCEHITHERKNYSFPEYHYSPTKFECSFVNKHRYMVSPVIDERAKHYGEQLSEKSRKQIAPIGYRWSLTEPEIIKDKIERDLVAMNASDSTGSEIFIVPTVEVFYTTNKGFVMWLSTDSKVRIKISAFDKNHVEIFNKTYETIYSSNGLDKEYEGSIMTVETVPPNIVLGICLRRTLDQFYKDIYSKFPD